MNPQGFQQQIIPTFGQQQNQTNLSKVNNIKMNETYQSQYTQILKDQNQSNSQYSLQNPFSQAFQNFQSHQFQQTSVNYFQEESQEKIPNKSVLDSSINIHEVCLNSSKSQNRDLNQVILLQLLIQNIIGNSDFEIKIGNIDPQIQKETLDIVNNLKASGFTTKLQMRKEYESRDTIYQVEGQPVNNISKQDKMVLLYLYHQNYLQKINQAFPIFINTDQCQFQQNQNQYQDNASTDELRNFKNQLQQTVILSYNCQYESEAQYISLFLNKTGLRDRLSDWLGVKQLNIFPSQFLLQEVISPSLRKFAEQIATSKPSVFVIGICEKTIDLKKLQDILTKFIQNQNFISNIKEIYQLQLNIEPPNESELHFQLKELQTKDFTCEITVTKPQFVVESKKYFVQVQIQFWFDSSPGIQFANSQIQTLKNKIERIYSPFEEIKLKSYGQIRIWQNLLSSKFENIKNSMECQTKYKNQSLAKIELRGETQTIKKKKQIILEALDKYKYTTITQNCDSNILKVISEKKEFQQLFRQGFEEISKPFGDTLIRIFDIENNIKLIIEIFYAKDQNIKEIIENVEKKFVKELISFQSTIEMREILDILKLRETKFQEQFEVYFSGQDDEKPLLVGQKNKISEVEKIIKQLNESKSSSLQSFSVDCGNKLILQKMLEYLKKNEQDENYFSQNNKIYFLTLTKNRQQQSAGEQVQQAKQQIKNIESKLIITQAEFSEKEVKFIKKNFVNKLQQYESNNELLIQFNKPENQSRLGQINSAATTLKFNDKILQILYGDISKISCDAIVNSCNEKLTFGDSSTLSGVAQSIFQMAGSQYHSFCADYIKKNEKLKVGEAITYNMPNSKYIKHIINVATPIYSSGNQIKNDQQDIVKNLIAVFKVAENLQIQSIALPMFGGGACGFNFGQTAQLVLKEIINYIFANNTSIKIVYIIETMDTKINILQEGLSYLLQPPRQVREIQYQWQWKSDQGFIDYDDENINRQIDEAYEQYLKNKQELKVDVHFSFTKQPGTHKVDLVNQKITQIAIGKDVPFCYKIINNSKQYFINNEAVPDQLTEYFTLQEYNKQTTFTIFYSRYFVVFNDKEMYQMNQETQFKRLIQPIKTDKFKQEKQKQEMIVLWNKPYSLDHSKYEKTVIQKSEKLQMFILSFDVNLNKKIIDDFQQEIINNQTTVTLEVPNLKSEDLQTLETFVQKNSKKITGNVAKDTKIIIDIFKSKEEKIKKYIDLYKQKIKQYPSEWVRQSENFIKQKLNPNDQEYMMIQEFFKKSDQGTIHEISRIQNKALWDNYITEKNKLITLYQSNGIQLTSQEQSRYFWHGVRGQHPKVIYSGLREAFDYSYSNAGSWGYGIYFAENASYSRGYSYTLSQQDDPVNTGKKVFLCCLVTTGKVEPKASDGSIKRPSQGFDCVSSTCNTIFILYSMDVRRAYPAYEVIFT